jgi:aminopeptidase N
VDTTLAVSIRLLNKNTYEKAGWVLHMLRHELGDDLFIQCIRSFYSKFKYGNALTEDFQQIVEILSGKDFDTFFRQWFYQPGHPILSSIMKYKEGEIYLTIRQHQEQHIFFFPLDVSVSDGRGNNFSVTLGINSPEQTFTIPSTWKPTKILFDPETWLLFEHNHSP